MSRVVPIACAALWLACAGASAMSQVPGGDVSTAPSAAPRSPARAADTQQDAEAAFERARAECRRVDRGARRDCVRRAQGDYDKTQRAVKPPRRPPPAEQTSKP
jgi:hypothetical protein